MKNRLSYSKALKDINLCVYEWSAASEALEQAGCIDGPLQQIQLFWPETYSARINYGSTFKLAQGRGNLNLLKL